VHKVELRRNVRKVLDKIQPQERAKILSSILELGHDPRPRGVEKITNTELWRIRVSDYRIVYSIDDKNKIIVVVRIGHRREIYRGI
jgi:mRNA interferase RelE/StbE